MGYDPYDSSPTNTGAGFQKITIKMEKRNKNEIELIKGKSKAVRDSPITRCHSTVSLSGPYPTTEC